MINVFGSSVGEEELAEIRAAFAGQWTGMGPRTAAFEKSFAEKLGGPDFVLVNSCSNGLHLAVKLLDLPPGSEIIMPSFTFPACANAAVLCGHRPVFCDLDPVTYNPTAETISKKITSKTKAVMVVHYAGLAAPMGEISALGLPVVEDAAHAADSTLNGKHCGTLGEVGVFSFDSMKNIVMGEGGGLWIRDPEKVKRARLLRYCGMERKGFEASANTDRWWEQGVIEPFPRFLPNDIAAGMGIAQLKKFPAMQARRKHIWDLYQRELAAVPWLVRPADVPSGDRHTYFTYAIRVLGGKRDKLARHLYDKGIYSTVRFYPLHFSKVYGSEGKLPVTETLNEEALNIPLHPRLSDADLELILSTIKAFKA